MSNALERLKADLQRSSIDTSVLSELEKEYRELNSKVNELEKLLIMIVRTGWPWDAEGEPNAIYNSCRGGFTEAMLEARDMLGLGYLSSITRTEPKT